MIDKKLKIFLIVGEESGENIANQLLTSLEKQYSNLEIYGIFSEKLINENRKIKMIFPYHDISVVGLFEVIKHLPRLLNRIYVAAKSILTIKPDLVISIDSYDFCIRVAKIVKREDKCIKFAHIVAPAVWLYNSKRAKVLAKYYDILFCLLPFETEYFTKHGLKSYFIGNPAIYTMNFLSSEKKEDIIGITLGSRIGEIERHSLLIQETILMLLRKDPRLKFAIFATSKTYELVNCKFKDFIESNKLTNIISIYHEKIDKETYMPKCKFAIAKIGTNTVEWTLANVPIIVYYKSSIITYYFASFVFHICIKYLSCIKLFPESVHFALLNILLNKKVIPEFVETRPTPDNISEISMQYLNNLQLREEQLLQLKKALLLLTLGNDKPTDVVANYLKSLL